MKEKNAKKREEEEEEKKKRKEEENKLSEREAKKTDDSPPSRDQMAVTSCKNLPFPRTFRSSSHITARTPLSYDSIYP